MNKTIKLLVILSTVGSFALAGCSNSKETTKKDKVEKRVTTKRFNSEISNVGYTTESDSNAQMTNVKIQWSIEKSKYNAENKEKLEETILNNTIGVFSENNPFKENNTKDIAKKIKKELNTKVKGNNITIDKVIIED